MIAVFCADARERAAVRSCFPHGTTLEAGDWPAFDACAPSAGCLVVVVPWLADDAARARLASVRRRFPDRPLLVVTRKDADNLRLIRDLAIEEVVWLHETERELLAAVRRAGSRAALCRAGAAVASARHLPPRLRVALAAALERDTPVRSVMELAALASCDRRTLWHHWRRSTLAAHGVRPEDVIDWLLLLHAVGRKRPDRNWPSAAAEAGIHQHTLARIARRLLDVSLRELEAGGVAYVAAAFAQRVMRPLTSAPTVDAA